MEPFATAARAIVSTVGTTVFCSTIVLVGLIAAFRFQRKSTQLRSRLKELASVLDGAATPVQFRVCLEDISTRFYAHQLSKDSWREFRDTFIYPEDESRPLRTSCSATEYFSFQDVGAQAINLRLYAAVPGILTGLGILGTFVGLVAGIYLASTGLQGSPKEARDALGMLLQGASLAFLTSIAGLVIALPLSLFEKREIHDLENACQRFAAQLDGLVENVTLEQLAAEQMTIQERQARQLERFNTDFALSVAQALDARLNESMAPLLNRMIEALEGLRSGQTRAQDETLERVVREFQSTLRGATDSQMQGIAGTFASLNASLERTVQALDESQAGLRDVTATLAKDLRESLQAVSSQLSTETISTIARLQQGLGDAGSRLSGEIQAAGTSTAAALSAVATRLQDSTVGLEAVIQSSEKLLEGQAAATRAFVQVMADLRKANADLAGTAQPLTQALQQLKTAADRVASGITAQETATSQFKATAAALAAAQQQTNDAWKAYEQRFVGVDRSMAKTFEGIQTALSSYTEQMNHFVTTIDQKMAESLSTLSGAIQEFADALDDYKGPQHK